MNAMDKKTILDWLNISVSLGAGLAAGEVVEEALNSLVYSTKFSIINDDKNRQVFRLETSKYSAMKDVALIVGIGAIKGLVATAVYSQMNNSLADAEETVRSIIRPNLSDSEKKTIEVLKEMGCTIDDIHASTGIPMDILKQAYDEE